MLISNKKSVIYLVHLFKQLEINQVVICPGSRNLPLILSFTSDSYFNCISCIDERSAGFIALGMVKSSQKPVIVLTTSGSAAINLGPAMAEAYYQNIPLIAITADRPKEWINRGENQTMVQTALFQNYVEFEMEVQENSSFEVFEKQIQSLYKVLYSSDRMGNVHINLPFSEPLLDSENIIGNFRFNLGETKSINKEVLFNFSKFKEKNTVVYLSTNDLSEDIKKTLNQLIENNNWVVICDINTNFYHKNAIYSIDLILTQNNKLLNPDILITIGEQMLSKHFRTYLKSIPKLTHIDIHPKHREWNLLSTDYQFIKSSVLNVLHQLKVQKIGNPTAFTHTWLNYQSIANQYHEQYMESKKFSEFNVINCFLKYINMNSTIYWGNSSAVRYANWCNSPDRSDLIHLTNRGLSGIEGVLSSAIGYQLINDCNDFYCVIGDIGFLYEFNALQSIHLINNIKIIVLNNHGGKIFENIHSLKLMEKKSHILTPQKYDLSKLANLFDIQYFKANNFLSFLSIFENIKNQKGAILFEIDFPEGSNLDYQNYFQSANHT